jgi:hypothetical protein
MDNREFDAALIASALSLAAESGWSAVSVVAAANAVGLPLDRARRRFPCRGAVLMRLVSLVDQTALASPLSGGTPRERLFELLMRRIDFLQRHRAGVLAVMRALPTHPAATAALGLASLGSMGWMLEAAGLSARGLRGRLRKRGLLGIWLWTLRAWRHDESEDLATVMATLDQALARAEQLAGWLGGQRGGPAAAEAAEEGEAPSPAAPTA